MPNLRRGMPLAEPRFSHLTLAMERVLNDTLSRAFNSLERETLLRLSDAMIEEQDAVVENEVDTLRTDLASSDAGKGAELVGYGAGTVDSALDSHAADLASHEATLTTHTDYITSLGVPSDGTGADLIGYTPPSTSLATTVGDFLDVLDTYSFSSPDELQQVLRDMRDGLSVKIVCIGDSITYGELDTAGQATTPYPDRLRNLLRQYYNNLNISVVNKGVSGSTVAGMLSRYATDIEAENPDLVIFNGGTNDSREANSISLATYTDNVETYLNQLNPIPTIVLGITPRFKEQRSANGEGVIHFYREALRKIAEGRGLPYVDAFKRFHELYKARAYAAGYISKDGSHYTEDGYRYLGDTIFAEAFANDDIFIKAGQFKDARGQWLVTEAADSTWGGTIDNQDADALVVANATVRAHLFLEEWSSCALVVHCLIDGVNDPDQGITFTNQSLSSGGAGSFLTSPKPAGATEWYAQDYAVVMVNLRPGLNNIQLSTTTSFRITGFSVIPQPRDGYLVSYNPDSDDTHPAAFFTSTRWEASPDSFSTLRGSTLTVSALAAGYIEPYFMIVPDPVMTTSRWRFRATVRANASFYLGQQSTSDVDYMPVYRVQLDGTNVIVTARDHGNTSRTVATVAYAFAGVKDIKVDLKSGATGWTLWVDGTLIYTDDVPLSVGLVLVSSPTTGRTYWNPPIKKGPAGTDTGVLVGESWHTFSAGVPVQHVIDDASADRTLTYT